MMKKTLLISKRVQIDKAQATIVAVIGVSVFVTVFSLVSSKALWAQRNYQAKVIGQKNDASKQLDKNIDAVSELVTSYKQFVSSPVNVLGGNPAGQGELDGDNARLVLDALPSKYDFPALTTSLEKILTEKQFKIDSITGTDDEVAQSAQKESGNPVPIDMPFQIAVKGSYSSVQDLTNTFEKSIRPFNFQKLLIKGSVGNMQLTLDAKTYYQPEKTLNIKTEVVR